MRFPENRYGVLLLGYPSLHRRSNSSPGSNAGLAGAIAMLSFVAGSTTVRFAIPYRNSGTLIFRVLAVEPRMRITETYTFGASVASTGTSMVGVLPLRV